MARRYVNPAKSSVLVTDKLLGEARSRLDAAAGRVRDAEHADPTNPGWDVEYEAAAAAARAAERRVTALEQLRAAQVERSGRRDVAVKSAAGDLKAIASGLAVSRDQVSAAAAAHLKALAALAVAEDAHNTLLAQSRAQLAERGLRVRDDLVDVDQGQEHAEGVLDGPGLRTGGEDWTPIAGQGVACHALRQVFGEWPDKSPLAAIGKYVYRPHELRLRLPSLKDVGAVLPTPPERPRVPERVSLRDFLTPPEAAQSGGVHYDKPRRRSA